MISFPRLRYYIIRANIVNHYTLAMFAIWQRYLDQHCKDLDIFSNIQLELGIIYQTKPCAIYLIYYQPISKFYRQSTAATDIND